MLGDAGNLHTFVDAFRFIGDHPVFLLTKTLEQLQLSGAAPFTDAVSDSRSRSNMTSTMAREPASADRSPRVPLTICTGSRAYAGGVMALEKLTARGAPTSEMW